MNEYLFEISDEEINAVTLKEKVSWAFDGMIERGVWYVRNMKQELLDTLDKVEQQQQKIERLKEAEFKACSKHHEFIEDIEVLEKDISMIKDLAVDCDADERTIQPHEILDLINKG